MTKTEEILERDDHICAGCGGCATQIKLGYAVSGRCEAAYPDFAWRSLCDVCVPDRNEIFDSNSLLEWEAVTEELYELTGLNGARWLIGAIARAQSRKVNLASIVQMIEGTNLVPEEELG